jgi:hypothetical protein
VVVTATTMLGPDPGHRTVIRRLDAVFGGPVWWATHLAGMYWLVPRACRWGTEWPMHAWTALMALLCVRAGISSVQLIRAARLEDTDADTPARRDLYLGWLGLLFSIFFGAVTVFEGIPAAILDPCF